MRRHRPAGESERGSTACEKIPTSAATWERYTVACGRTRMWRHLSQKCPFMRADLDPHLIHRSLHIPELALRTSPFDYRNKNHLKNVGPIRYCEPFYIVIHQVSLLPPLSHAACASMSTTTTMTTTTTTTRDRGDRYGSMEWAERRKVGKRRQKRMKDGRKSYQWTNENK